MKILCLHGKGTSAGIFKSQTSSIRAKLGPGFSFDFVDGTYLTTPPPDIKKFYPPPYYSYWEGSKATDIKASFKLIHEKLKLDGPYDGVLLFSQGAALIASLLLYLQSQNQPPPFKFAIFICGGVNCSVLEDLGVQVTPQTRDWEKRMNARLDAALEGPKHVQGGDRDLVFDPDAPLDPRDLYGLDTLQPAVKKLRINIPTVHIYGNKDPLYPLSRQLVQFCDPTCRRSYNHGEGHGIPRRRKVSEDIAALVEWAVDMGSYY